MSNQFKSNGILLLASLLWGLAFVAQRQGMLFVGPFTFNGLRFALGALSLVPLLFFMKPAIRKTMLDKRLLSGSIMAGVALFLRQVFSRLASYTQVPEMLVSSPVYTSFLYHFLIFAQAKLSGTCLVGGFGSALRLVHAFCWR